MNGFDFRAFWLKYRNLILGALFFFLVINFCNRQSVPGRLERTDGVPARMETPKELPEGKYLKSYEEILRERGAQKSDRPSPLVVTIILLGIGSLGAWLYQNRWRDKWFPGKVQFKAVRWRDKKSGRLLLRLIISNKSKESQTFMSPLIVFSRWGTQRQFKLKGSSSEHLFPLTLTPGTAQSVVVDLDHFFEKLPELKSFNRVGGAVTTTGGKRYHNFSSPLWLGF